MIRLLMSLFNKSYEPCKSCETLKEQLEYERANNKEYVQTLLNLINPKVVEKPPIELEPINQSAGLFSRRRAVLEARDREEARIKSQSKNLGRPDNTNSLEVSKLENELGIVPQENQKEVS